MEKTPKHFRAAHPLLFISIILLAGIVFAKLFVQTLILLNIREVSYLLILSLVLLQFIITRSSIDNTTITIIRPNSKMIEGIIIYLMLFSWGVLFFFLTKEKNLFQIPYPKKFITYCRNYVIKKINASILSSQSNAFAKSLLLGVKSNANKELLNAYKQLGIIHIVAISGMHLDIIFKNILRVTSWLPRKKILKAVELLLVLGSVWTYTLMAFASPSIVRASVFFSIYYIGKFSEASSFTLNVIAGGILIFLLFDIKNIENMGLQLSYAAVLGIHLFYPLLNKMMPMDNPILVFLWSNLCISIAAQLTTLPILLYYFHQLSSMVLISNFIMVPLSTLLLYALALLVITPNLMGLSKFMGQIIEKYIIGINKAISYLNTLPINRPLLITFGLAELGLFYIAILIIYAWLYVKSTHWLLYLTGLFCCYSIIKLFSTG
ncbi:MAG: ComEC/Rec2 family competence protein [Chitinophagia bacterium]|nr:ComEC/Rec2 family competence protein [Chitinophagia bacterium]